MFRKEDTKIILTTIVKIADGGTVLATWGVVDLPCVPSGQRRDLFFCAATRTHLLTRWTLRPKTRRKVDEANRNKANVTNNSYSYSFRLKIHISEEKWKQTYATASVFWTGFQDRVTVLLYDGGLWKRS